MKLFGGKRKKPAMAIETPKKKRGFIKKYRRLILLFLVLSTVIIGAVAIKNAIKPPAAKIEEDSNDKNHDGIPDSEQQGLEISVEDQAERKQNFFTMVIACTDQDKTRTDAMIVAAFDVKNNTINMMNVPRDTYSKVDRNLKKINSAYAVGQITQLKKELNMLLGIPIDRYAIFDFDGVAQMVDSIGGIEYEIPFRMKYTDPTQDLYINFQPGLQKLDGKDAVRFLRWRENDHGIKGGYADGDLGRIKADQQFLMTLAKKMLTPSNIIKVPEIASSFLSNTDTDFSKGELVWLGLAAVRMSSDNITMQTLPGFSETIYEPGVHMNQSYFFPDEEKILELVNEKFNPYLEPITKIKVVDISTLKNSSSGKKSKKTSSIKSNQDTSVTDDSKTDSSGDSAADTKDSSTTTSDNNKNNEPFDDALKSSTN
ncbi:MAG: LCP family protein [Clostridiales bacterium]|nr:LCP family protein [Clostridiales bacterium]